MTFSGEGQGPALVPGRDCGTCSLCCILPDIAEFDKPANQPCRHCVVGGGCDSYDVRPSTCRDFFCLWRMDATLGPEWEPSVSRMMLYGQGPQLTVLVEPEAGAIWREERYLGWLEARARALKPQGGYVVVYAGEEVSVVKG
ncbi:hypothetical protein QWE_14617 [Agrobacterium albertimagni AOL15]|uniref:Zinc/iron-chelating domain-containing protein n=1 Tax=Agrobacterium albertimagni AOL15 TaxID=1156935 RepID=K2PD69_9HYPH|nr:hypothetical protein [Agrobacterium albertimagni]EKF58808.1 hypothetical protein QWE_14617 [Agrobacterium albertimagni AOL15]